MTENNDKLQDLSNKAARSMIAVVDAMCQRGAFKGEELTTPVSVLNALNNNGILFSE